MKQTIYLLTTLLFILLAACSKEDGTPDVPTLPDHRPYATYWYYDYEAASVFKATDCGFADGEFDPYTIALLGDTLFVANTAAGQQSIALLSRSAGRPLRTLKSWRFNGEEKTFKSAVEAIVPAGNRLYVAERESRIHVFSLPALEYITCIGNGKWGGAVFQAQALAVKDGYIYARDKDSRVSIYREVDATPEKYEAVSRWRHCLPNGAANNGFNPHSMTPDERGNLLLTDYEAKKIRLLDCSLVGEELLQNASIDVPDAEISTAFRPKRLALTAERYYVTGDNNVINVYDRASRTWGKPFTAAEGFTFSLPVCVCAEGNSTLWVSDSRQKALVKVIVHKNEIREYTRAGEGLVRVSLPATRGAEARELLIDVVSHEVVSER